MRGYSLCHTPADDLGKGPDHSEASVFSSQNKKRIIITFPRGAIMRFGELLCEVRTEHTKSTGSGKMGRRGFGVRPCMLSGPLGRKDPARSGAQPALSSYRDNQLRKGRGGTRPALSLLLGPSFVQHQLSTERTLHWGWGHGSAAQWWRLGGAGGCAQSYLRRSWGSGAFGLHFPSWGALVPGLQL